MSHFSRRAGYTLMEIMVSVSILGAAMSMLLAITMTSLSTYDTAMVSADLEAQSRRVLERMAEELQHARVTSIVPVPLPPAGSSSITFQTSQGFQGSNLVMGTPVTFSLAYMRQEFDNGKDDNGNGLADEMVLQRTQDGVTRRLAAYVRENGLRFLLDGSRLSIRVEMEKLDGRGASRTAYAETTIRVRN